MPLSLRRYRFVLSSRSTRGNSNAVNLVGTIKTHVLKPTVDICLFPRKAIISPPQKASDEQAGSSAVREHAGGEEEYGDAEFIAAGKNNRR